MENKWLFFLLMLFALGNLIAAGLNNALIASSQFELIPQLADPATLPQEAPTGLTALIDTGYSWAKTIWDGIRWEYDLVFDGGAVYIKNFFLLPMSVVVGAMTLNFIRGFIPFL